MKNQIKILKDHNEWRRGADTQMGSPVMIGMAIDSCIQAAERYELLRTLNVPEFKKLFQDNLSGKGRFDELVDELIKARS